MRKGIYVDYAATSPIDPAVLKAMMPYLKKEYGNPSSVHMFGQKARAAIERSREQVAKLLRAEPIEVVFTSGATEANNLVVRGLVQSLGKIHVVVSEIEHESVLSVIEELKEQKKITVTYISVRKDGVIAIEDVHKAITKDTRLVSIMAANSEIGTVQPIRDIGKIIEQINEKRSNKIFFHTDAVQAVQFLSCNVAKLRVDFLTMSAHKIYGPKGVGALFIKKGTPFDPQALGGEQELGMRSGTENVAGIVGLGAAAEDIQSPKTEVRNIKMRQMRDKIIQWATKNIEGTDITGSISNRLENNVHIRFKGLDGKDIVLLLDQKGVAASAGSACSENAQEPSHVLKALGFSDKEANSGVRITLGKYTTAKEVEAVIKCLASVVSQLRTNTV